MSKILFSFLLIILPVASSLATTLTPDEALKRISVITPEVQGTRSPSNPRLLKTFDSYAGEPAIYLFSHTDEYGLMVVSANDEAPALLGFSDEGKIDINNLPPGLDYWINEYVRQIGNIRHSKAESVSLSQSTRTENKSPIAPLVTTLWDQGEPYNNLCPKDGNSRSMTGCVATAMAQVMKYHNHPEKGKGSISYDCGSLGVTLSMDFSDITFQWGEMIDSYSGDYSSAQSDAVAQLMVAAGYSVEMNYSSNQSGAATVFIAKALANYFSYDRGIRIYNRNDYSYTSWSDLIYDNLKNVGPVIYAGSSLSGTGHAFVCDGYLSDGYFHFNWGWSGAGNGYYLIDALSPSVIGTGGGDGGYNFAQLAIMNIKPSSSASTSLQREFFMYGSLYGSYGSGILSMNQKSSVDLGWGYLGVNTVEFYLGAGIVKADSSDSPTFIKCNNLGMLELEAGYWYPQDLDFVPSFNVADLKLETGVKYKIFAAASVNSQWQEVTASHGSFNYFYITKTGPNKYEITNFDPLQFSAENLTLLSDLYAGNSVKAGVSLSNESDTELTRGVSLLLLNPDKSLAFSSDCFLISLQPGETREYEWTTSLDNINDLSIASPTEFLAALYDVETATIYYISPTKVTMNPNPGKPEYNAEFLIADTPKRGNTFLVEDPGNFDVITRLSVTKGYFSYPVTLAIFKVIPNTNTASLLLTYPYEIQFVNKGETKDYVKNIDFPGASVDDVYCLDAFVNENGNEVIIEEPISTFFIVRKNGASSGIEKIYREAADINFNYDPYSKVMTITGSEGVASVTAYSLDGKSLTVPVSGTSKTRAADLSGLQKGYIIINAIDGNGRNKSIKVLI